MIVEECMLAALATKTETVRRGRRPPQQLRATSILLTHSPPQQYDSFHNGSRRHPTAPQDR